MNCLPLLVVLLVLVQLTGATSAGEEVFKEWIIKATPRVANIAEDLAYIAGHEDLSKYIGVGRDIISGATAVFAPSGAVVGISLIWQLMRADSGLFTKEEVEELKSFMKEKCLKDLTACILEECRRNEPFFRAILKLGAKSLGRLSVKFVTKNVVKVGLKGTLKGAAMPVGVAADVAQAVLEYAGYEEAGKKVGMFGNVASGAMVGFALGGPAGAGVGAAGGTLLWLGGEAVGCMFGKMIE